MENGCSCRRRSSLIPSITLYHQPAAISPLTRFMERVDGIGLLTKQEEITGEWKQCTSRFTYRHNFYSVVEYHRNLTRRGYRALIHSGDHDLIVPFIGTEAWIRSLNYTIIDDWRSWWVDRQIAGYTRFYDNSLTFATVKGVGHTAPEYKPRQRFVMFK